MAACLLLCLLARLVLSPPLISQTYTSLWSGLFKQQQKQDRGTPHPPPLPPPPSLLELHSRLLQRLAGGGGGDGAQGNHTDVPSALRSLFGDGAATFSGLGLLSSERLMLDDLLSNYFNFTAGLWSSGAAALDAGAVGAQSLVQKLQEHLAADWARADPRQLAALAMVQAWSLSSLLALHASRRSSGSTAPGLNAATAYSSSGGGSGSSGSTSGLSVAGEPAWPLDVQHSLRVPAPQWASFHGMLCLRLQNFGDAEGFRAILLGTAMPAGGSGDPCAAPTAVAAEMRWSDRAAFVLDCAAPVTGSDSATAGLLRASHCQLAVATAAGRGVLLEAPLDRPLLGPPINALRVRLCNRLQATQQASATTQAGDALIALKGVRLNGRPLLPRGGLATTQASSAGGCTAELYRISSHAAAALRGFVLSGRLALDGGSMNGSSGITSASSFGLGEAASVELTLGEYQLLSAAASRLFGGLKGGSGGSSGSDGGG